MTDQASPQPQPPSSSSPACLGRIMRAATAALWTSKSPGAQLTGRRMWPIPSSDRLPRLARCVASFACCESFGRRLRATAKKKRAPASSPCPALVQRRRPRRARCPHGLLMSGRFLTVRPCRARALSRRAGWRLLAAGCWLPAVGGSARGPHVEPLSKGGARGRAGASPQWAALGPLSAVAGCRA